MDYIGIANELHAALKSYRAEGGTVAPILDIAEMKRRFEVVHDLLRNQATSYVVQPGFE